MLYTLSEIFKNKIFRIPGYQRGYSWEKRQLEQLWGDLNNIFYPHPRNSYHFTGVLTLNKLSSYEMSNLKSEGYLTTEDNSKVIFNNQEFTPYHLVDGQQRTTTLLILVSLLIDSILDDHAVLDNNSIDFAKNCRRQFLTIEDENNHRIHLFGYDADVPSHHFLKAQIFNDEDIDVQTPDSHYTKNLLYAKTFFANKISGLDVNNRIKLLNKINERLLFAELVLNGLPERTVDASMAFETLNFRGKELSNLELLKNRILYLISRTNSPEGIKIQTKEKITQTWLELYRWLGTEGEFQFIEDEFLKAFWILCFSDYTQNTKYYGEWLKTLFEETFTLSGDNKDIINLNHPNGINNWSSLLGKCIQLWFIIKNPYDYESVNGIKDFILEDEELKEILQRINTLPQSKGLQTQKLILAILAKHLPRQNNNENEDVDVDSSQINIGKIKDLLIQIERHNFCIYILNGKGANFNSDKFFRNARHYFLYEEGIMNDRSGQTNVDLLSYIKNELTGDLTLGNITKNINKDDSYFSWKAIYYLFYQYEIELAKENGEKIFGSSLKTVY